MRAGDGRWQRRYREIAQLLLSWAILLHLGGVVLARFDAVSGSPRFSSSARLPARDEAFLEDLSARSFRFFWEQADPATGLVRDRARVDGGPHDASRRDVASIAATGFGLTALCIAAERRWVTTPAQARARAPHPAFLRRAGAAPARLVLPLRRRPHRRKGVDERSLVN